MFSIGSGNNFKINGGRMTQETQTDIRKVRITDKLYKKFTETIVKGIKDNAARGTSIESIVLLVKTFPSEQIDSLFKEFLETMKIRGKLETPVKADSKLGCLTLESEDEVINYMWKWF